MFFPSLVQYRYRGGIFLFPVTELSLKPAILAGNEGLRCSMAGRHCDRTRSTGNVDLEGICGTKISISPESPLLLVRAPLRSDKEHRECGLGGDMRD